MFELLKKKITDISQALFSRCVHLFLFFFGGGWLYSELTVVCFAIISTMSTCNSTLQFQLVMIELVWYIIIFGGTSIFVEWAILVVVYLSLTADIILYKNYKTHIWGFFPIIYIANIFTFSCLTNITRPMTSSFQSWLENPIQNLIISCC
jgi:hypothetical protein